MNTGKMMQAVLILTVSVILVSVVMIPIINSVAGDTVKLVNEEVYFAEDEEKETTVITFGSEVKINGKVITFNENVLSDIVPLAISDTYYMDCIKSAKTYNINYWTGGQYKSLPFIKSGTLTINNTTKVATGTDITFAPGHTPEPDVKTFTADAYKEFATHVSMKQTDKCYITYGNGGSFYLDTNNGYYGLQNPGIGYAAVFHGTTLLTGSESSIQFNLEKAKGTTDIDVLTMPFENKIFAMAGDIRVDAYFAVIPTTAIGTTDDPLDSTLSSLIFIIPLLTIVALLIAGINVYINNKN